MKKDTQEYRRELLLKVLKECYGDNRKDMYTDLHSTKMSLYNWSHDNGKKIPGSVFAWCKIKIKSRI